MKVLVEGRLTADQGTGGPRIWSLFFDFKLSMIAIGEPIHLGYVGVIVVYLALLTALMTAVYAFRAYYMTFKGETRLDHETAHHVHESPWTMTLPLVLLAAGTFLAGYLNLPEPFLHLLGSHA